MCRDVHVTSNVELRNNVRLLLNVELISTCVHVLGPTYYSSIFQILKYNMTVERRIRPFILYRL